MKSIVRWLVPFLLLSVISASAQPSLLEQLGVAQTNFKITLNDYPLEVAAQGITLRAVGEKIEHRKGRENEQINDIAYRAYHLEFAFKQKYKVRDGFEVIEFFEGNDVLHAISLKSPSRKISTPNGRRYETNFIAISLEGIPLVMLDSIDRINFRRSK